MNLADILRVRARETPHAPALVEGVETVDWETLYRRSLAAAWKLRDVGVRPGDHVALSSRSNIAYVILCMAIARLGAACCGLDWRMQPAERSGTLAAVQARLLVTDRPVPDSPGTATALIDDEWWQLPAGKAPPPQAEGGEAPVSIILSSGTTGRPKAVLLSHRAQAWRGTMRAIDDEMGRGTRVLTVLPIWSSAAINGLTGQIVGGATTVFHKLLFSPEELVEMCQRERIEQVALVPTVIRGLLALSRTGELVLPGLKSLTTLGSILNADEKRATMAKVSPHLYERYGAAGAGVIARAGPADIARAPGTVGQAQNFVQVDVVDIDDRPLPTGEIGRVRVRSPGNAIGYFGETGADERNEIFANGYVYPGDLGRFDAEGLLFLEGRAGSLIIRGGQNLHPEEVERVLLTHPAVAEVAVFGRADPLMGEVPIALVVSRETVEAAILVAHCRAALLPHKVPAEIHLVDALPKTAAGKIHRAVLAASAGGLRS